MMDRIRKLEETYDAVASDYDAKYQSPIHTIEDSIIGSLVGRMVADGRVLDVGCGTGHLLNLTEIPQDRYLGVDISQGMLTVAESNHPHHTFIKHNILDDMEDRQGFDVILGIYGILNYTGINALQSMLDRFGHQESKFSWSCTPSGGMRIMDTLTSTGHHIAHQK